MPGGADLGDGEGVTAGEVAHPVVADLVGGAGDEPGQVLGAGQQAGVAAQQVLRSIRRPPSVPPGVGPGVKPVAVGGEAVAELLMGDVAQRFVGAGRRAPPRVPQPVARFGYLCCGRTVHLASPRSHRGCFGLWRAILDRGELAVVWAGEQQLRQARRSGTGTCPTGCPRRRPGGEHSWGADRWTHQVG